jgi:hypothetical protein
MFSCSLCSQNVMFIYSLCNDCLKVKKHIDDYGLERVSGILDKILKVQFIDKKIEKELKRIV